MYSNRSYMHVFTVQLINVRFLHILVSSRYHIRLLLYCLRVSFSYHTMCFIHVRYVEKCANGTIIGLKHSNFSRFFPTLNSVQATAFVIVILQKFLFLEDDVGSYFSKILMRCFLAEGVVSEHSLFLATADENPTEMWKVLTAFVAFF